MRKLMAIAAPTMLFIILFFSSAFSKKPTVPQSNYIINTTPVFSESKLNPRDLTASYKQRLIDSIQAYFDRASRRKQIIGVSVAIVKCDSVIYVGGYGKRDATLDSKVDAETVFRIGSVSKGFAGILTGIHVEKGLVSWTDRLKGHIPDFKLANATKTDKITLSHVLSHTAGLPYHSFTNLVEDGLPIGTITNRFKEIYPLQEPGSTYNYQNAIFALGGTVIEKVTNKPIEQVIKSSIFEPLGMNLASASYEGLIQSNNIALPHRRVRNGWKPLSINKKYYNNAVLAGGINASATDMAKWMKFLLGNNPEVMSASMMKQVFEPKIQVGGRRQYYQRWPGYQASYYGYGWRIHKFKDKNTKELSTIVHHGGYVNNYRSEIAIYPEEDLGICVLFNNRNKLARTCIPDLYKIIQEINAESRYKIIQEPEALL